MLKKPKYAGARTTACPVLNAPEKSKHCWNAKQAVGLHFT